MDNNGVSTVELYVFSVLPNLPGPIGGGTHAAVLAMTVGDRGASWPWPVSIGGGGGTGIPPSVASEGPSHTAAGVDEGPPLLPPMEAIRARVACITHVSFCGAFFPLLGDICLLQLMG